MILHVEFLWSFNLNNAQHNFTNKSKRLLVMCESNFLTQKENFAPNQMSKTRVDVLVSSALLSPHSGFNAAAAPSHRAGRYLSLTPCSYLVSCRRAVLHGKRRSHQGNGRMRRSRPGSHCCHGNQHLALQDWRLGLDWLVRSRERERERELNHSAWGTDESSQKRGGEDIRGAAVGGDTLGRREHFSYRC